MVFAVNPSATKTFAQFQVSPVSVLSLDIFEMMAFYRLTPRVVARAPLLVDTRVLALLEHPLPVVRRLLVRRLVPLAPKAVVPSESVAVPLVS
jgi:hypothetical protein